MVAGLQILSSGFMGSIRGQNIGAKNKIHPNILGVAMAYQSLLKRANLTKPGAQPDISRKGLNIATF